MSLWTFEFARPWVLLLAPLVVALLILAARSSFAALGSWRRRFAWVFRLAAVSLLLLALAGLELLERLDDVTVIFVADMSHSIPPEERDTIRRFIEHEAARRRRERGDRAGVVYFGRNAAIEVLPSEKDFELSLTQTLIDGTATDIQSALRVAAAAFPRRTGGRRIVLVSDGNATAGDAEEEARALRALGVTVDVVPVYYEYEPEILVEKVVAEPSVEAGEPFSVRAIVRSTQETEVQARLYENGRAAAPPRPVRLRAGTNAIDFGTFRKAEGGAYVYEVEVEPLDVTADGRLENNKASAIVLVGGETRVLFVSPNAGADRALIALLGAEGFQVEVAEPGFLPAGPQAFNVYDAVVLSNVPAELLGEERMRLLESLVRAGGIGLVAVGGDAAFGAGGYRGTPLEKALPVDMDISQKKVVPNGALAMVVHSSEMPRGNYWARVVVQRAIRALRPNDYAGVLYYDFLGGESWLFPMTRGTEKPSMLAKLRGFEPGDMLSFETIMTMALEGLTGVRAGVRHMIVLSDGDPSPPSPELLKRIVDESRITISTICYGAHGSIPAMMPDLAKRGGGTFHYLRSPADLPEIFLRETRRVLRTLIREVSVRPRPAAADPLLEGIDLATLPPIHGYVVTTAKPLAKTLLVTPLTEETPDEDPILAVWNYGIGRSAAFTSDSGWRWASAWPEWPGYRRFWGQLVRWASRKRSSEGFHVSTRVEGERAKVTVDAVDREGRYRNGLELEARVVGPGPRFRTQAAKARQTGPGRYELEFPAVEPGAHTVTIRWRGPDGEGIVSGGVTVPYSPEYAALRSDLDALRRIARAGGGVFAEEEPADWFRPPEVPSRERHAPWRAFLVAALALVYLDIAARRLRVDVRAAARRVRALIGRVLLRRRPVEKDATLDALLKRKAEVARRLSREARAAREPQVEREAGRAPAERGVLRGGRALSPAEGEPAGAAGVPPRSSRPPAPPEPAEEEVDRHTARLLEAKRRARARERGRGGDTREGKEGQNP